VVDARVANSGQTCIAPKRVIVEKQVKARWWNGEKNGEKERRFYTVKAVLGIGRVDGLGMDLYIVPNMVLYLQVSFLNVQIINYGTMALYLQLPETAESVQWYYINHIH
jgi:hypothetical protein